MPKIKQHKVRKDLTEIEMRKIENTLSDASLAQAHLLPFCRLPPSPVEAGAGRRFSRSAHAPMCVPGSPG